MQQDFRSMVRLHSGMRNQEIHTLKILDYSAKSATVQFGQNELLLVMALLQEGRDSLGSNSRISKAIDRQFTLANILVEDERRVAVSGKIPRGKIKEVSSALPKLHIVSSNDLCR
jgi:hypothetical protein